MAIREAVAASILVLLAFAPSAPALPLDCSAALTVEESIQNDAESGSDAADAAEDAFRILYDGYYWGFLSAVESARADVRDWYVFAVTPGTRSLMANVIASVPAAANEVYLPDDLQRFYLTITAPDGESKTVSSAGGVARFEEPIAGDYLIEIWTVPRDVPVACEGAGSDVGAPDTPIARNHGLYVGCHPVCAERPSAR